MKKIIIFLFFGFAVGYSGKTAAQSNDNFQLSTHILDISKGKPAGAVDIELYKLNTETQRFDKIDSGTTDQNGRVADFLSSDMENQGVYKLKFQTQPYFDRQNIESIYPYIEVVFKIFGKGHYHIPITVSANGYSTYRGN